MTTDLLAAFAQVFGDHTPQPDAWSATPDFPEPDLYVSESEARWLQRAVDDHLGAVWGPR